MENKVLEESSEFGMNAHEEVKENFSQHDAAINLEYNMHEAEECLVAGKMDRTRLIHQMHWNSF